jgi:Putative auto-transporter adhesin, head GIN domain
MKNTLLLAAFTMMGLLTFAQNDVISDKNAEKRNVTGFHAIRVSGGIDLYFSQGDEAVAVSAASISDREKIRTEVVDGVLKIYMDSHFWGAHGDRKLKAYVSCKVLDALEASGGSDVYIKDVLKGDKLNMNLSGGSDLKGKIDVGNLSVTQSGGSDSYITGTASRLSVNASGGSDFHGYDLLAEECNIQASGGSDVHITANKELNVIASGGSDVYYKGPAVIRAQQSSGSSSINHKS